MSIIHTPSIESTQWQEVLLQTHANTKAPLQLETFGAFAQTFGFGEMAEWPMAADSKSAEGASTTLQGFESPSLRQVVVRP